MNYTIFLKKKRRVYAKRLIWMHKPFYMPADTRYERYLLLRFSFSILSCKKLSVAQTGKRTECSTCGSIDHNPHSTPVGDAFFQLFHFSRQSPDILNMLSPVVSMVLPQYLHVFCHKRQQKRIEKKVEGEKKSAVFLHQPKLYLNMSYISAPCQAPHPSHSSFPLASWRAE